MNGIVAPFLTPKKRLICREELPGVHDSRPLRQPCPRLPFCLLIQTREVLPQRGHGLRPLARQPLSSIAEPHARAGQRGPRWR
jgi:hypothetical protein